jgi:ADP-ribose pyrophosphatase YjhB (NUDIX family)
VQRCTVCGEPSYHAAKPCACAILVDDEGRVLLARRAHDPEAGRWDLPGGFLEPDESPEDGLRREMREETGLDVEVGRYVGSFVDVYGEGGDNTLNIVFVCRPGPGDLEPADDVSELRWFAPEKLPPASEIAFRNGAEALGVWRGSALAG